ncbi:arabinose efflux permease [Longilinea arvoryzae]|uniref:Arabinose efflux permease n=1 Tax=Longilinea arvoryzae TaxID=360412 RepID=A0A0S7BAV7_9CHLR|nr:MFS transporter [Longilinea arvoryzae]GAP14727.1 arabinose efflux permease [Longilinea arvoryzae]
MQSMIQQNNFRGPQFLRALSHRNYRLWFVGQGTSLIGSWMETMAIQVLVYDLTGSAAALGMVNLLGLIPLIPLSLWGGSIADRFPKRTVLIFTQSLLMLEAFIISALTWTGVIQVWHVYALSLLLGAVNAVDTPVRQAFTVEMVEGKDDLTNAIGLNSALFNLGRALGPALAGIIVAATGEAMAFLVNGITFIAVIFCLIEMKSLPIPNPEDKTKNNTVEHMKEGLTYVRGHQIMMILISLVAVSAFLSMPFNTLMPVFATNVLGKSASPIVGYFCNAQTGLFTCQSPEALPMGMLLAVMGIGAMVGAVYIAAMSDHAYRGRYLTMGNLLFPIALLLFSVSKSFTFSLVVMFVTGFSFVCQNVLANTMLQLFSPDAMRGRVMSLYSMMFQGMSRLGSLQAGLMADWISAPVSVGIGAAVSLVYALFVAIRYPIVRKS